MFSRDFLSVYWVAGTPDCRHKSMGTPQANLLHTLENALRAGISCFQLREKGDNALNNPLHIKSLAQDCQDLCRQFNVPFVLNNDVALALAIGADGVHIGQGDMAAREVLAQSAGRLFVGLSNSSAADLQRSFRLPELAYWAVGAIFHTQSKPDATQNVGLDLLRSARQLGGDKPIVAIGGITADNVASVHAAGADGVAVISAITQAADVVATVRRLRG